MIFLSSQPFSKLAAGRPLFFMDEGDCFHTLIHSLSLPVDRYFIVFMFIVLFECVLVNSVFFCVRELLIM